VNIQRAILVYNPKAGRYRPGRHEALINECRESVPCPLEVLSILDGETQSRLEELADTDTLVVIAGGDGTLHHAINHFSRILADGSQLPYLAYQPMGSANDAAPTIESLIARPLTLQSLADRLSGEAPAVRGDLGRIQCGTWTRYFVNFVGLGAPALWVRIAESLPIRIVKRLLGHRLAYTLCNLAVVARNSSVQISTADEGAQQFAAWLAGNSRYLGGGMDLGPQVGLGTGDLALFPIPWQSRHKLVGLLNALKSGTGPPPTPVSDWQIEVAGPLILNLDGELERRDEDRVVLDLDVLPGRIRWV
jgi:diacylglycerol kinase family enzyme